MYAKNSQMGFFDRRKKEGEILKRRTKNCFDKSTIETMVGQPPVLESRNDYSENITKESTPFMQKLYSMVTSRVGKVATATAGIIGVGLLYGALEFSKVEGNQPKEPAPVASTVAANPQKHDDAKPAVAAKAAGEKQEATEQERKQCIQWQKSYLEQGIHKYKFSKDGKFRARLNKDLAEYVRNNDQSTARIIVGNKLYETPKVGSKGEIEIEAPYSKTFQFGIFDREEAEGKCGDYIASIRKGEKKKVAAVAPIPSVEAAKKVMKGKKEIREEVDKGVATVQKETDKGVAKIHEETDKGVGKIQEETKKGVGEIREEAKKKVEEIKKIKVDKPEYLNEGEVLSSVTRIDMEYRNAWGSWGGERRLQSHEKYEVRSLQKELATVLKDSDYMAIKRTPKVEGGSVPNMIVEFSKRSKEDAVARVLKGTQDTNNLEKDVMMFNFDAKSPTYIKGERFFYDSLVPLEGLTPEKKAGRAVKKILEHLKEMREKGNFDTYWFQRDIKQSNPDRKAPVQAHLFKSKDSRNILGAVFTAEGTEVKFAYEEPYSINPGDNDNIQIGKALQPIQGDGGQGTAAASTASGGSIGGGPM